MKRIFLHGKELIIYKIKIDFVSLTAATAILSLHVKQSIWERLRGSCAHAHCFFLV